MYPARVAPRMGIPPKTSRGTREPGGGGTGTRHRGKRQSKELPATEHTPEEGCGGTRWRQGTGGRWMAEKERQMTPKLKEEEAREKVCMCV